MAVHRQVLHLYTTLCGYCKSLKTRICFLDYPSRWYLAEGFDEFRNCMLERSTYLLLHDFLNPEEVFPKTNIRGGICYFLGRNYDKPRILQKLLRTKYNHTTFSMKRSLKSEDNDTFIRHGLEWNYEKIKIWKF
jgi:hypothetical protein